MQRGSPGSAAVSRGTHPLVSLPPAVSTPAFQLRVVWDGPRAWPVAEPKRYRVSATILIEGEVTADELRELFLPAERLGGRVSITAASAPPPAESAPAESAEEGRKRLLRERVRNLVEAYRDKLGEPVEQVHPAMGAWLPVFGEDVLRLAITETARANVVGRQQRYDYLKELLRIEREERRRRDP